MDFDENVRPTDLPKQLLDLVAKPSNQGQCMDFMDFDENIEPTDLINPREQVKNETL